MASFTLEERLSTVEAELAKVKQKLGINETRHEMRTNSTDTDGLRKMTITEKLMAMADEMPEDERRKMPADLAEQHNHYVYGWPKK